MPAPSIRSWIGRGVSFDSDQSIDAQGIVASRDNTIRACILDFCAMHIVAPVL
jgi:hypothetical protein